MFASDELDRLGHDMNNLWERKENCRRDLDRSWDHLTTLQNSNGNPN